MIFQIRTLHALCFLVVDCGHIAIDVGFMVHLKRLLHIIWHFLGILMHLFFKKNLHYQHVRNAVLDVCAKSVPVWGKRREMRGLLRGKIILTCPF